MGDIWGRNGDRNVKAVWKRNVLRCPLNVKKVREILQVLLTKEFQTVGADMESTRVKMLQAMAGLTQ